MGVTGRKWCDFFVCPTQDSFSETINFYAQFWNLSVTKAYAFCYNVVLEKLFTIHHVRAISKKKVKVLYLVSLTCCNKRITYHIL